jgi:hypothetical protein
MFWAYNPSHYFCSLVPCIPPNINRSKKYENLVKSLLS